MSDDDCSELEPFDINGPISDPPFRAQEPVEQSRGNLTRFEIDAEPQRLAPTRGQGRGRDQEQESWGPRIQILLKKIGDRAGGYRWMHGNDAGYYSKKELHMKNTEIVFVLIIFILAGLKTMFAPLAFIPLWVNLLIGIVEMIFIGTLAALKTWRDNANHIEKVHQHKIVSSRFHSIVSDIQVELAKRLEKRTVDDIFLNNITRSFNDLMIDQIRIRDESKKAYINNTKKTDINQPIITGGIDDVQIVIEQDGGTRIDYAPDKHNEKFQNEMQKFLYLT